MPGVEVSTEKNRRILLGFDIFCDQINALKTDSFDFGCLFKGKVSCDHIVGLRGVDLDNESGPGFRTVGRNIDHVEFFDFMDGKNCISIDPAGAFTGFSESIVHPELFGKIIRLIHTERTVGFDIDLVQDNGFRSKTPDRFGSPVKIIFFVHSQTDLDIVSGDSDGFGGASGEKQAAESDERTEH
jgi:hypothetical protein